MCCFSGPVDVSQTNIFARSVAGGRGRQYLAYEMTVRAAGDVAMILPLPVPPGSPEGAVEFIDLSGYPELFVDLTEMFVERSRAMVDAEGDDLAVETLAVVQVGSFEASFVPSVADFARLDPRFRLPAEVWSSIPGYDRFGFAVFKLRRGERRVHPMAFTFPRVRPEALFFPTVHIHDGRVHAEADFDHALFCQWQDPAQPHMGVTTRGWKQSSQRAGRGVRAELCHGLIDGGDYVYQRLIRGRAPNRDVYLER